MSIFNKLIDGARYALNRKKKKKDEIDDDDFNPGDWKGLKNPAQSSALNSSQNINHNNLDSTIEFSQTDNKNIQEESIVDDSDEDDEYEAITKKNMQKFNEDEKPRIFGVKKGLVRGILIFIAVIIVSSFLYTKYGHENKTSYNNSQSRYKPATSQSSSSGANTYTDLAQAEQSKENPNKIVELNRQKNPNNNQEGNKDVQRTRGQTQNRNYSNEMPAINTRQYNPSIVTVPGVMNNQQNQQQSTPEKSAEDEEKRAYESAIAFALSSTGNTDKKNNGDTTQAAANNNSNQNSQAADNGIYKPVQQDLQENGISAGTMIPAMLLTGFNSDIKNGQVVAQLMSDTYDSLYGDTLLIPAGSRLIGSTSTSAQSGQDRVDIEWQTLLLPDGSSYSINGAMSCSEDGYQGIKGNVNNHNSQKILGGVLSSAIAALGSIASGNNNYSDSTYGWHNSGQLAVQGATSNLLNTASSMFQKNLNTQATITIDPGIGFNVYLKKQIVLEPY